jgi:hypothetical protein
VFQSNPGLYKSFDPDELVDRYCRFEALNPATGLKKGAGYISPTIGSGGAVGQ